MGNSGKDTNLQQPGGDDALYMRKYVFPVVAEIVGFDGVLSNDQAKARTQLVEYVNSHPDAQQKAVNYMEAHRAEYVEKIGMVQAYGMLDDKDPADKKYTAKSHEELSNQYTEYFINRKDPDGTRNIAAGLISTVNTILIADLCNDRAEAVNMKAVAEKATDPSAIVDGQKMLVSGAALDKELGITDPSPSIEGGEYIDDHHASINLFRGKVSDNNIENPFKYNVATAKDYERMLADTDAIKNAALDLMLGADKDARKQFLKGMAAVDGFTESDVNSIEKTSLEQYASELGLKLKFQKDGDIKVR